MKSQLMSETPETSQSAKGPYVAMADAGLALTAWTAAFRDSLLVKVPGGGDGGDGGDGGGDGGNGDWNCTTKDSVWTAGDFIPFAKEKRCSKPGAAHSAPFQPSPGARCAECLQPSVISRVHVAPSATANGTREVYGAPPLSVVPSEQLRLQPTSLGRDPPEQMIAEVTSLASQPPSHDASISSSAVRQAPRVRPW